jgi:hypothetical protein
LNMLLIEYLILFSINVTIESWIINLQQK